MVNLIDNGGQEQAFGGCLTDNPAGPQHPRIEGDADDGLTLDEQFDLIVGKLPIARHERAAIIVTGHHRAREPFQRLKKTLIGKVRHIENHADAFEFL